MTTISANLQRQLDRLRQACDKAGRAPDAVRLLAVSKTFGPQQVCEAVDAGQRSFGENYVQEGVEKILALRQMRPQLALEWHCIGPVQTNKTRWVAEHFDWVQSIDRLKVAERLSAQRPDHLPPLQVCVQVNVDGGANKSGVVPAEVAALAAAVAALPRLRLRGLMCIPEPASEATQALRPFQVAHGLWAALNAQGHALDTLSMGMSDDLEAAVAAGSTLVRVGRAVFGQRAARQDGGGAGPAAPCT